MEANDNNVEMERARSMLKDTREHISKTGAVVQALREKVIEGQLDTSHGLSFLEMKYHLLLSYLIDLGHVTALKLEGRSLCGSEPVDRLIEVRTVLERIRPIDQKLRYQVDKLVRIATAGQLSEDDPLRFRALPANLASRLEAESSDSEAEAVQPQPAKAKNVYVPPKIAAVHYDGDETADSRQRRLLAAARRRALSSAVVQELGREYLDTPEEVRELGDTYRQRSSRQQAERTKYEEDFMTRLPETKQERRRRSQLSTDWSLGSELTQHTDLSALDDRLPSGKRRRPARPASGRKLKGRGNKRPKLSL